MSKQKINLNPCKRCGEVPEMTVEKLGRFFSAYFIHSCHVGKEYKGSCTFSICRKTENEAVSELAESWNLANPVKDDGAPSAEVKK